MRNLIRNFWNWYERNLESNTVIVAALFVWQLAHLYWLTADVVLFRLIGYGFFHPNEVLKYLIIFADYMEIPALITGTILYIGLMRKESHGKNFLYLVLINSQWLHLYWLTDEFVVQKFATGSLVYLPVWLAWTAIFIDYLEFPVILDTVKRSMTYLKGRDI